MRKIGTEKVEIIGKGPLTKRQREIRTRIRAGMDVKHQVWEMRRERGWSQAELGKRVGLPPNIISRFERPDDRLFTMKTLIKFANAFDVQLEIKFVPFLAQDNLVEQPKKGKMKP